MGCHGVFAVLPLLGSQLGLGGSFLGAIGGGVWSLLSAGAWGLAQGDLFRAALLLLVVLLVVRWHR